MHRTSSASAVIRSYPPQVAQGSSVPMISASSTSPDLSNGKKFPFFLRTVPSDAFGAVAMVDILQSLWSYNSVGLVHSTDAYTNCGGTAPGGGGTGARSPGSQPRPATQGGSRRRWEVPTPFPEPAFRQVSSKRSG